MLSRVGDISDGNRINASASVRDLCYPLLNIGISCSSNGRH